MKVIHKSMKSNKLLEDYWKFLSKWNSIQRRQKLYLHTVYLHQPVLALDWCCVCMWQGLWQVPMMIFTAFLQNVGFDSLTSHPGTQGAEHPKSAVCNAHLSHCYTVIRKVFLLMVYCVVSPYSNYSVCFNLRLPRLKMHGTWSSTCSNVIEIELYGFIVKLCFQNGFVCYPDFASNYRPIPENKPRCDRCR
jgi:hypothetical protein